MLQTPSTAWGTFDHTPQHSAQLKGRAEQAESPRLFGLRDRRVPSAAESIRGHQGA